MMSNSKKFMDVNDLTFSDEFIDSLIEHNLAIRRATITVAGGLDEAKDILKNKPENCNAYDIMYKDYGYIGSWFMVDHNITINLDDLKIAVEEIDEDE